MCMKCKMRAEQEFVKRMLIDNPHAPIMSFVADSYDVYNFTNEVTREGSEIRNIIESRPNQRFILRPDSGKPLEVIARMLNIIKDNNVAFSRDINKRIVFRDFGILWGDGITPEVIEEILIMVTQSGYAAENMVFGSGGDIMQNVNRDTLRFAIKCSNITKPDGTEIDVYKNPITDPGKKSKKGKVTTYFDKKSKVYFVDRVGIDFETSYEVLEIVYENGELIRETSLQEIRDISEKL